MSNITPQQKVKWLILALYAKWNDLGEPVYPLSLEDELAFDSDDDCRYQDAANNIRANYDAVETGLPCPLNRGYGAKAVAAKLPDGSWVGWTFYYGGGKHGEPDAIPWIEDAYNVSCVEQEIVAIHRTFTVAEVNNG